MQSQPNVILILIDSLRADAVSVHDPERQTTPNLELLARDGVVFENFFSNSLTISLQSIMKFILLDS